MVWHRTAETGACAQYDAATQQPFEDVACLYQETLLGKTYMNWEFTKRLDPPRWQWILTTIVASAVIQYFGLLHQANKPPVPMRRLVSLWNVLWCGFTTIGFLRMAPLVYHNFSHYSIRDNVCEHSTSLWLNGTTELWAVLWLWTKMFEILVESMLVVLLKQPCGPMQWFNNYAYVLAHGWHLQTAPIPGGFAVICIYYAIVALLNCFCFVLNIYGLDLQMQPTILLDIIHLIQTLSGVVLSVTTLHYWKEAVGNGQICHVNEQHIRYFAFAWSGGHILIMVRYLLQDAILQIRSRGSGDGRQREASKKMREVSQEKKTSFEKANSQQPQDETPTMKSSKKKKKNKSKKSSSEQEQSPSTPTQSIMTERELLPASPIATTETTITNQQEQTEWTIVKSNNGAKPKNKQPQNKSKTE